MIISAQALHQTHKKQDVFFLYDVRVTNCKVGKFIKRLFHLLKMVKKVTSNDKAR